MQFTDIGGNVFVMAQQFDLIEEKHFVLPSPTIFNANQGLPVDVINQIYNAADAVFTPTLGEGWGLSLTEAMATKTPIIAPDNTSITEILADNRGYLVPSGDNPSAFTTKENDNERIRPTMNVEKAADALEKIMQGKKPDVEAAYKWATALSWKNICEKEWRNIISEAAAAKSVITTKSAPPMNRAERRRMEKEKR
jgi:glycosyltransferase involved in cell wall biosynthesis